MAQREFETRAKKLYDVYRKNFKNPVTKLLSDFDRRFPHIQLKSNALDSFIYDLNFYFENVLLRFDDAIVIWWNNLERLTWSYEEIIEDYAVDPVERLSKEDEKSVKQLNDEIRKLVIDFWRIVNPEMSSLAKLFKLPTIYANKNYIEEF